MPFFVDNPEADRLARELSEETGEPVPEAVLAALRDQLIRKREVARKMKATQEIQRRYAALPILDLRTPDEILGYDENGIPT